MTPPVLSDNVYLDAIQAREDKGLTKVGSQMRGLTVCAPDSPDYKHQSSLALREMGGESAPRRSTWAPARTWIASMRPACARRS